MGEVAHMYMYPFRGFYHHAVRTAPNSIRNLIVLSVSPSMKLDKVTPIANTMAEAFDGGTRMKQVPNISASPCIMSKQSEHGIPPARAAERSPSSPLCGPSLPFLSSPAPSSSLQECGQRPHRCRGPHRRLMTWVTFVTFVTFVTLMSSVLAGPSLLSLLAVLIMEWGSQGAVAKWTRDLYPRRTQQK